MKQQSTNSSSQWNKTRFSSRIGIEYPIIQGPLGGLSTQRLTATVSNFGGLGSFGAHGLTPSAIKDVIDEIRALTSKPFAINLWVSMEDEGARSSGSEAFSRSLAPLAGHIHALGGTLPTFKPYVPIKFEDQVRVLLDAKVPVFSFIVGVPPREILDECRAQKILTIGTATTPDEAIVLEQADVDIIVASGFEAGGHRGSFLFPAEESLTGTFSLVPQVADAVSVPVIAAGGIADARGIVAAFALGAEGVQIGTAFLACDESGASALHRNAILTGKAGRTGLTKGFTGRLARGVQNQLLEELNRPGVEILPYPLQRFLVRNLVTLAEENRNPELLQLWAGQSANLSRQTDATALLQTLTSEVSAMADRVLSWNRHPDSQSLR
ncbi:nitronate monooxygenase [Alloacidobacterium dinghuense]|uniref:Nitronate monooxygenase n=1 Tax=Alloacidobacterium dinghuense TaxID=2763107 RepID=A0A7G8BKZ7_9BACT|nr:nitronate monooxygenase [Alloacidobacterium dinghuense]QNI33217.1 nitronate monooxygenase [Alloacidobacterium dinghuense]